MVELEQDRSSGKAAGTAFHGTNGSAGAIGTIDGNAAIRSGNICHLRERSAIVGRIVENDPFPLGVRL
jgi:hypothetical protein